MAAKATVKPSARPVAPTVAPPVAKATPTATPTATFQAQSHPTPTKPQPTEKPQEIKKPREQKPPIVTPPAPEKAEEDPKKKKKKWPFVAAISFVVALAIILGAVGISNMLGGDKEKDKTIEFGSYPQTLKADGVNITSTTDDRGYYLGSDGEYYAKVTATPCVSGYKFSTGDTVTSESVYYFKVEPIKWRILSKSDGTAFIVCDSIIANHRYDDSSNNYADSEIRAWLNETFLEKAFSEEEQSKILATTVDNSVSSTGYSSNSYACENTNDKIFLLSYAEVTNSSYFESAEDREMQTSDYSRATGAWMSTSSDYYGNGWWWLRSPYRDYSYYARGVGSGGHVYSDRVGSAYGGVLPALQIRL